jgi:Na+/H+ antiporter NhaC
MKRKILFILFMLAAGTLLFANSNSETVVSIEPSWISLLPPLTAITLAMITKQAHLSLFLGIVIGACFITGGVWSGITSSLDHYLVKSLAGSESHTAILMFTMAFGGLIGVMSANGSLKGVLKVASKYATNNFRGQLLTGVMGLVIFFDDYSNSLLVGNMMRPFTDKVRVSREKLSYLVDSTAAPVASLAAVSTWSIFQMSLLEAPFATYGITQSTYVTFLQSIPYSFYCILAIIFLFLTVIMRKEFGPMLKAETRSQTTGEVLAKNAKPMMDKALVASLDASKTSHWSNAAIPIALVLGITIGGLFITGLNGLAPGDEKSFINIISTSNPNTALIWGSFFAGFTAIAISIFRGLLNLTDAMDAWINGARSMVMACVILVLAWVIGDICAEIKTAEYIVELTKDFLTPALLPPITFITAALISFSTGSSWATMSILVPVTVPMVIQLMGGDNNVVVQSPIFISTFAAVLSGSVFGDHSSPIADTTVLSSTACGADHIDHVRTQLPYALVCAAIALFAGYFLTGIGVNVFVCILAGIGLSVAVLKIFGKTVPTTVGSFSE